MPQTIQHTLQQITQQLSACSDLPRFEAEQLLQHIMHATHTQLYTEANKPLSANEQQQLQQLIQARLQGEPLAYLLGSWEFWSLELKVTRDTLIPRPETERIVEWVLNQHLADRSLKVADLGTGSGAIAIALAHERPNWQISASDISPAALLIAKQNAQQHGLTNIEFSQGCWCQALVKQDYNLIISNPPYVTSDDPHWQGLNHEPQLALDGGTDGLNAYRQIISQAKDYLQHNGQVIVEHGYNQAESIQVLFKQHSYRSIQSHQDLAGVLRFTSASPN